MEDERRVAVVLGIEGPEDDGRERLNVQPQLKAAVTQSARLAQVLRGFDYSGEMPTPVPDTKDMGAFFANAFGDDDLQLLHVSAHGRLGNGKHDVWIVGPDGEPSNVSLGGLVNSARQPGRRRPMLLLFDLCYSGHAVELQLANRARGGATEELAWIITASGGDLAWDCRLTTAVADVLEGYLSGKLTVDPSVSHVPWQHFAQAVGAAVDEMAQAGYQQAVESTFLPSHVQALALPFFRNPRYDPALPSPDEQDPDLDPLLDPAHFLSRVRAAPPDATRNSTFFKGRTEELERIANWLRGQDAPTLIVSGKPGVGKSALIGVAVCRIHPKLRDNPHVQTLRDEPLLPRPAAGRLAVIHARRRSVAEVCASLARQWQLPGMAPGTGWTGRLLVERLHDRAQRVGPGQLYLVMDAVDEASDPSALVTEVLEPIFALTIPGAPIPLCRTLVGLRYDPRFAEFFRSDELREILDLGKVSAARLQPAVRDYVAALLAGGAYGEIEHVETCDSLSRSVAAAVTFKDPATGPLEWGEFLVAGLYARHLLSAPPVAKDEAEKRGSRVPRTLADLLRLEFGETWADGPVFAVGAALAYAEGLGMPEEVIAIVAGAVAASAAEGHELPPNLEEVRQRLQELRFYLRQDVDTDGATLYRLFHQSLADELRRQFDQRAATAGRRPPGEQGAATPGRAERLIWAAILAKVSATAGRWKNVPRYLWRHAPRHAAAAGGLQELLQDPDFLMHADPTFLMAELARRPGDFAGRSVATYRASAERHCYMTARQRGDVLAVDACRFGIPRLASALTRSRPWQPRWSTNGARSVHLRHTLHLGVPVVSLAVTVKDSRTSVVALGEDGTTCAWDLPSGLEAGSRRIGKPGIGNGVIVAGDFQDRAVVVLAGDDQVVRMLELVTGRIVGQEMDCRPDRVTSVALGRIGHGPVVVVGSAGGGLRVWDPMAGRSVSALRRSGRAVSSIVVLDMDQLPRAISGSIDGGIEMWDLLTDEAVSRSSWNHGAGIRALCALQDEKHPLLVSGGSDGSVRVWDLSAPNSSRPPMTSGRHPITALAPGWLAGRAVVLSGSFDGTLRVWDLDAHEQVGPALPGHNSFISCLALGVVDREPLAVSGSADGTVRVWNMIDGEENNSPVRVSAEYALPGSSASGQAPATRGHSGAVSALAVSADTASNAAISGSANGTVRVWDLSAGHNISVSQSDHQGRIWAVACAATQNGGVCVSAGQDGTVRLWDWATGASIGGPLREMGGPVYAVAIARLDDQFFGVFGGRGDTVWMMELPGGRPEPLASSVGVVRALATGTVDRRPVVVVALTDELVVYDLADRAKTGDTMISGEGVLSCLAVGSADGRPVAVTGHTNGAVTFWDLATRVSFATDHDARGCAVLTIALGARNGRAVAVGGFDDHDQPGSVLRTWDVATGALLDEQCTPDAVRATAIAPDGTLVIGQRNDVLVMAPTTSAR